MQGGSGLIVSRFFNSSTVISVGHKVLHVHHLSIRCHFTVLGIPFNRYFNNFLLSVFNSIQNRICLMYKALQFVCLDLDHLTIAFCQPEH